MEKNVLAIIQKKLSPKCKDQNMFIISYKISALGIRKAMCDLGASINIIPLSIYLKLDPGPLKKIGIIIQLADMLVIYLKEVLEDILVQVDNLIFLTDFYVLDIEDDRSSNA